MLIIFLVAATATSANAQSADKENKNAEKVVAMLKALDINHPYLTETAKYIEQNTADGYLYLKQQDLGSGFQMQLRYDTNGLDGDNLQLNFTEKGANYNITGSRNGVMYHYGIKF